MIPQFPLFKKLELSDRKEINKITKKYPPFSDFNFASLWCWNLNQETIISILNNNLVVRFQDYLTMEFIYSFLGTNKQLDTIEKLLEYLKQIGCKPELKLLPEVSIKKINDKKFIIKKEMDHCDYIYSANKIIEYKGNILKSKRKLVKRLQKRVNIQTKLLDLTKHKLRQEIIDTFHRWVNIKDRENIFVIHEFAALNRLLTTFSRTFSPFFLTIGIYRGNKMIGFNINELLGNHFAVIHFEKGDTVNYPEIGAYLFQITAEELSKHGVRYINLEQDLGLDGLRRNKLSYKPDYFLHKYILKPKMI